MPQRGPETERGPGEGHHTLSVLSLALELNRYNPLRLADLTHFLEGFNALTDLEWFQETVNRYTPRQAEEIMVPRREWDRVLRFAQHFSRRHFPLAEGYLEMQSDWWEEMEAEEDEDPGSPYSLLRRGVPFETMGLEYEEVHNIWDQNMKRGVSIAALMARHPAIGSEHQFWANEFQGLRTAWTEAALDEVPRETLELIPRDGIPLERLEEALRETPLEVIYRNALWAFGCTGIFFLDNAGHREETFAGFSDDWEEDTIEFAREEWREARRMLRENDRFSRWLQQDLPGRFRQIMDFTLERLASVPENFRKKRDE